MPTYSWDASVFIAWLNEEHTAPLGNIEGVVEEIDNNQASLVVSVMAFSEVLEAKHTPEQMASFREFLKRSNVINADTTIVIAEKAGQVRNAGIKNGRRIKTPDAIFLATAIVYKVDALHSLDPDLLNLNGLDIAEGVTICLPIVLSGQGMLFPSSPMRKERGSE